VTSVDRTTVLIEDLRGVGVQFRERGGGKTKPRRNARILSSSPVCAIMSIAESLHGRG
jgi:hypothetical protein